MNLIGKFLDKLIFGALLILALQIPQLADHYQQFLSGLYQSTKAQVDGYQTTAKKYKYPNVQAMIKRHLQNKEPSVRADAKQKLATLDNYKDLKIGLSVFEQGNLLDKTVYMFNPAHYDRLNKTISNFKMGVPLTISGLGFAVVVALLLNFLLTIPFIFFSKRRKRKGSHSRTRRHGHTAPSLRY